MVPPLLLMTAEVPFYAATVARARLARLNDRLTSSLSGVHKVDLDRVAGVKGIGRGWEGLGRFLGFLQRNLGLKLLSYKLQL